MRSWKCLREIELYKSWRSDRLLTSLVCCLRHYYQPTSYVPVPVGQSSHIDEIVYELDDDTHK